MQTEGSTEIMTGKTLQVMQVNMLMNILETNPDQYDNIERKCNNKNSLEEIFSCMWDVNEADIHMTPKIIRSGKSDFEADELREKGNKVYKDLNFEKALEFYNLSIMTAQHPSLQDDSVYQAEFMDVDGSIHFPRMPLSRYGGSAEAGNAKSLAKGFANRSAILFELGQYEKCIKDIKYAYEFGYPLRLRDKLEERIKKCEQELQQFMSTDRESSRSDDLDGEMRDPPPQAWRLSNSKTTSFKDRVAYQHGKAPVLMDPNSDAPSLSSAVKITHIQSKGRAVVAVRDIRPGEILGVEKAYSVTVDLDKLSTNCSYCFALCLTPLPCPSCTKVVYCDESCRARALSEDHWLECEILPTVIGLGSDEITMAYKLLKTFGYEHIDAATRQLENETFYDPERVGFSEDGIYSSSSYRSIYNLCDNRDKYTLEPLIRLVQRAFVVTQMLKTSRRFFFKKNGEAMKVARENYLRTGALILSHLMKYVADAYTCRDIQGKVGKGVFPVASLINHSCNPSVYYYNHGRKVILRAVRPIYAGEEITIAYDVTFESEAKEERCRYLRYMHFFTCSCEACEGNWPSDYNQFPSKDRCFMCMETVSKGSVACNDCAATTRGKTLVSDLMKAQRIARAMRSRSPLPRSDFNFLLKFSELIHNEFVTPSETVCNVGKMLQRCFDVGF